MKNPVPYITTFWLLQQIKDSPESYMAWVPTLIGIGIGVVVFGCWWLWRRER